MLGEFDHNDPNGYKVKSLLWIIALCLMMCCDGIPDRLVIILLCIPITFCLPMNNFLMSGPKAYMSFAESVAAGVERGISECQKQFKWDRWNCPRDSVNVFKPKHYVSATREVAFVHAVTAAGVTYTLTRNCSAGHIKKCSCDDSKKGRGGANWMWAGCSDNVHFGERISRLFLDARVTGKDARAIVHLHNNDVGRISVRRNLELFCKCHGISGSCTIKTCWLQLADFNKVGDYLRRKYRRRALKVDFHNGALRRTKSNRRHSQLPTVKKGDLVYLEQSKDYCSLNGSANSYSTLGRLCSRPKKDDPATRWERSSCKTLCTSCGLKVAKRMTTEERKCDCKFHWCCEVRCKLCIEDVAILTCSL